jgi:hypothetical protein
MKSSYDFRENQKHLSTAKAMTRREFIRAGIGLMAVASNLEMISGYATIETPINRIALKGKLDYKIFPSQEGCLVGFSKKLTNYLRGNSVGDVPITIDYYSNVLGANPAILVFDSLLKLGFPLTEARMVKKKGLLPYIKIFPSFVGSSLTFDPDDIVQGRRNSWIKSLAKDAVGFGEKYGSFFFTTMIEPNVDWWPWSRKPNTIHALRRVWEIFEDQGANQYATWVWEAFCPAKYGDHVVDPESYYPGDKYVDWIGMNDFANLKIKYIGENTTFRELLFPTYEQMITNHPQKPMMISEFGRTPGDSQSHWLIDAYRSIKDEFPKLKAAIYYDTITHLSEIHDHTLDQKSLNTLKEIFKDPYWIMANRSGQMKI